MNDHDDSDRFKSSGQNDDPVVRRPEGYIEPSERPEVQALIHELTGGDPHADPLAGGLPPEHFLPSALDPGGDYLQHAHDVGLPRSRQITLPAEKVEINKRNPERTRTTMRAFKTGDGVPTLEEDLRLLHVEMAEDEIPPSRDEMPTPPSGQRIPEMHRQAWLAEIAREPTPKSGAVNAEGSPLSQRMSSELEDALQSDLEADGGARRFSLPWEQQAQRTEPTATPRSSDAYGLYAAPEAEPSGPYGMGYDHDEEHEVEHESLIPQSRDSGEWEIPTQRRPSYGRWFAAAGVLLVGLSMVFAAWRAMDAGEHELPASAAQPSNNVVSVPSHSAVESSDLEPHVEASGEEGQGGAAAETSEGKGDKAEKTKR